ncbi:protein possibly involved in post-translational modification of quorum-sensing peptides [Desulfitobacterium dehalogenans ATCC 51507]|uniref:Protein possibly involved in post-translational modification of quorum-sensing peptides n=1 Tax=Desulfitobacterium dehalogenans (strain ATCC 51507 / DSM 9161 / JW/IU-DC1) TaxID=756499 RepID=I4A5K5_DESDJ|nr:accessory gene regulator B family protein [Desulfitobacterium dehalogenans]AFL99239.1 protein possibly involved in post-translational modification of quorum-sensing peptides [Desulfitobacterium dehalogenans ATCC 51507]
MSLNDMSNNLTDIITRDLDFDEDKKEIIAYAIETSLLAILGTLLLILFALIVGALKAALISAVSGVLLRRFSGGAHFDSPTKCLVIGAIIYSALGVLGQKLAEFNLVSDYMLWISLAIALGIVWILAPVDSENKPIHSKKLKRNLRGLSIGVVLITFVISILSSNSLLSISMSLGVFYQSLTLLPIFNRRGGG